MSEERWIKSIKRDILEPDKIHCHLDRLENAVKQSRVLLDEAERLLRMVHDQVWSGEQIQIDAWLEKKRKADER